MKQFTSMHKDSITGMEMILSECSFNEACSFLETQSLGKYLGCKAFGNTTEIKFEKRDFFFDEERGYLLGK